MTPVLPGATIGILGGGQLGRMMTLAARVLGYHVIILDPDPNCAAGAVADRVIAAPFDDIAAATELANACDVITVEIEKIGANAMAAASAIVPVRPGGHVLHIIQDRARQRRWLNERDVPLGPFWVANTAEELGLAMKAAGAHAFVKSSFGGYDGRGQTRTSPRDDASEVWSSLGSSTCVIEKALDLEGEISVMVARRPGGACATFPPALNHHVSGVLDWSVIPAPISGAVARDAVRIARGIAEQMDVVGLLAVEMFMLRDGQLVVNELAPRPHNSFHHTEYASLTSQFEQGIREHPAGGDRESVRRSLAARWSDAALGTGARASRRAHSSVRQVAARGTKDGTRGRCGRDGGGGGDAGDRCPRATDAAVAVVVVRLP